MRGEFQESFSRGESLEGKSARPDEAVDHNKMEENVTNAKEPKTQLNENGYSVSPEDKTEDRSPSRECLY